MARVGDYVRVSGEEGLIERIVDDQVYLLKFITNSVSRDTGPDVIVDRFKQDEARQIDKEDIHRTKVSHYHQLDRQWRCASHDYLAKLNIKNVRINSDVEIFCPSQAMVRESFFKLNRSQIEELFWDNDNWSHVDTLDCVATNVIEVKVNDHVFRLSSDSWRIRSVLQQYIHYLAVTENQHITLKQLTNPKSPSYNHRCSNDCIKEIIRRSRANVSRRLADSIPLRIPTERFGFERKILSEKTTNGEEKQVIVYIAPCKKTLRNEEELETWFIDTRMMPRDLQMTNFDFRSKVKLDSKVVLKKPGENQVYYDLSGGRENFEIPVVAKPKNGKNYRPPKILYPRVKALSIPKYLDDEDYKNFMVCCDCKNGCQPSTCACMQLTQEGYEQTKDFHNSVKKLLQRQLAAGEIKEVEYRVNYQRAKQNCGYRRGLIQRNKDVDQAIFKKGYKLDKSIVTSGIYECHSGCACHKGWCNNRVVQLGIKMPMIVFRTVGLDGDDNKSCGWGIRAAVDIKAGTYLCDYFGALDYEFPHFGCDGNQYYASDTAAQLNFIETGEFYKHMAIKPADEGFDDVDHGSSSFSETRFYLDRYHGGVIPPKHTQFAKTNPHMRQYARPFVDASYEGNIGRFFNHACSPNLMIQNVFTDHQDPRFPHTSFFTIRNIKAGEELRWNYGYDNAKSDNGKCFCGTASCNGYYK